MSKARPTLKRKSYFVDERVVARARRALGVSSDSEAVRLALAQATETAEFWGFMDRTRGTVRRGSFTRT